MIYRDAVSMHDAQERGSAFEVSIPGSYDRKVLHATTAQEAVALVAESELRAWPALGQRFASTARLRPGTKLEVRPVLRGSRIGCTLLGMPVSVRWDALPARKGGAL